MDDLIARYQALTEQFPDNELARFSLGKAYLDAGRHEAALEHLKLALMRKPDWMVAQILIGKCELSLGRREEAAAAFERARQLAVEQDHEGPRQEMEELLADLRKGS